MTRDERLMIRNGHLPNKGCGWRCIASRMCAASTGFAAREPEHGTVGFDLLLIAPFMLMFTSPRTRADRVHHARAAETAEPPFAAHSRDSAVACGTCARNPGPSLRFRVGTSVAGRAGPSNPGNIAAGPGQCRANGRGQVNSGRIGDDFEHSSFSLCQGSRQGAIGRPGRCRQSCPAHHDRGSRTRSGDGGACRIAA